jgi:hypothetical protein
MSPVADLAATMAHYATSVGQAAFPVQMAATWPSVEPVDAAAVLTTAALERVDHLWTDRLAHLVRVFGGDAGRWVKVEGFTEPAWAEALARQSAGHAPGAAPVLLVHGDADEAVPVVWSSTIAAEIGAELRTYHDADHMGVADAARADVVTALLTAIG